jgi:hypothetical protein
MKEERSIFEMIVFTIGMLGIAAAVCLIFYKVSKVQEIPSDSPNLYGEANFRSMRMIRGEK